MGIKVLGPDINESLKGFAVNKKGEIRFGLGGLKGVGEAAVESIIEERQKKGFFTSMFDFIKRINQRTVNKKTLESLAYAGGFDCYTDYHRAQYFYIPEGETSSGLEKIVRFGNIYQNQATSNTNTLFGDLPAVMDIQTPKIPECPHWPLITQLDHEKEVTGMFLSGHPLDHHKFEMKHYGITRIADFNEFKAEVNLQPNPGRMFRLMGLVSEAQHKIAKNGNKYGNFVIEDYSGKTEITLFREDYLKMSPILQQGSSVAINGYFKLSYNQEEYRFNVTGIVLAETLKRSLTKQLNIEAAPQTINPEMINFLEKNLKKFPGGTTLKIILAEQSTNMKISLVGAGKGVEMNDELVEFLEGKPELEVQVVTN
jgi:DNA polymerase-3 subunit alpha